MNYVMLYGKQLGPYFKTHYNVQYVKNVQRQVAESEEFMKDIKLLETCEKCGEHLTLMESQRVEDSTLWAVKRCLKCGGPPVEEVVRLYSKIEEDALNKQIPMQAYYEYDDEFICPACSFEDDGYDVKTLKVCPECGQKLKWS